MASRRRKPVVEPVTTPAPAELPDDLQDLEASITRKEAALIAWVDNAVNECTAATNPNRSALKRLLSVAVVTTGGFEKVVQPLLDDPATDIALIAAEAAMLAPPEHAAAVARAFLKDPKAELRFIGANGLPKAIGAAAGPELLQLLSTIEEDDFTLAAMLNGVDASAGLNVDGLQEALDNVARKLQHHVAKLLVREMAKRSQVEADRMFCHLWDEKPETRYALFRLAGQSDDVVERIVELAQAEDKYPFLHETHEHSRALLTNPAMQKAVRERAQQNPVNEHPLSDGYQQAVDALARFGDAKDGRELLSVIGDRSVSGENRGAAAITAAKLLRTEAFPAVKAAYEELGDNYWDTSWTLTALALTEDPQSVELMKSFLFDAGEDELATALRSIERALTIGVSAEMAKELTGIVVTVAKSNNYRDMMLADVVTSLGQCAKLVGTDQALAESLVNTLVDLGNEANPHVAGSALVQLAIHGAAVQTNITHPRGFAGFLGDKLIDGNYLLQGRAAVPVIKALVRLGDWNSREVLTDIYRRSDRESTRRAAAVGLALTKAVERAGEIQEHVVLPGEGSDSRNGAKQVDVAQEAAWTLAIARSFITSPEAPTVLADGEKQLRAVLELVDAAYRAETQEVSVATDATRLATAAEICTLAIASRELSGPNPSLS